MNTYTEIHDFLLSVIGNVPYGVIAIDLEGYVYMVNQKASQILDRKEGYNTLIEAYVLDLIEDIPELHEILESCFKKGRKSFQLDEIRFKDKFLNINGRTILNGMIISINDITDYKKAQDAATLSLLKGQEMERRRLAKEIHDGVGPLMSTIKLNLESMQHDLSDTSEKALKKVKNMEELVQTVSADIRGISHALMPSALIDFGLVQALSSLADKVNNTGALTVNFITKGVEKRFNKDIELNLYRIAQELLNNALKYAQASEINIQLIQRKDKIMLTVEDDGKGFDPKETESILKQGIGMQNIKTRVHTLNGEFYIETQPGKGVHCTVEIQNQ